jgi:endoribonuclease LACTB2
MVLLSRFLVPPTWSHVGEALGRVRVGVRILDHDIVRFQASSLLSRQAGMRVSLYQVGDLLIDTGFSHAASAVLAALEGRTLRAIACTHHHEDHTGNAAALARRHGCPVYLRHPEQRWTEGVAELLPYRQLYWGPAPDYQPEALAGALPDELGLERSLEVISAPGHSRTHVVYHERRTGVVFTGDLLVSTGATATMSEEDPLQLAASLRRVADLEPSLLLSGHGLILEEPAEWLRLKADRMESAAAKVLRLHGQGVGETKITHRVFRGHWARERWGEWMTRGEFSRLNFVRAVLRHRA